MSAADTPSTPKELGYRWPAEWEPHLGTLLSWPHNPHTWPGKFEPVPLIYQRLVQQLCQVEPVYILATGAALAQAQEMVGDCTGVQFHDIPTNDAWARDHGPTFLFAPAGKRWLAVDWRYNAWGGKYPPWEDDDQVPRRLSKALGFDRFEPGIVMEGGAIDGNGSGLIMTTTECLLNPNRNPQLSRSETERYLCDCLGAEKILWLEHGIAGDDTDGHIDELARFVGPTSVVAAYEDNPADENYDPLRANFEQLERMTDQHGQQLEVFPLPMPTAKFHNGQRMPASYCNFYIANGVVIVPRFADPADDQACDVLAQCFPERHIVPLDALDLVWGLGAFHCITQQIVR